MNSTVQRRRKAKNDLDYITSEEEPLPPNSGELVTTSQGQANEQALGIMRDLVETTRANLESELHERPTAIPQAVYDQLPDTLRTAAALFDSTNERDVFLTAALPVLGGMMGNVRGLHGDGEIALNLFAVVAAKAGSGKGVLRFAQQLGEVLERRLTAEVDSATSATSATTANGAEKRQPSPTFYLAANSSARGFIDSLAANGGGGVLIDSEADTLATAWKQDWGSFKECLLKGFANEPLRLDRKGGERIRIQRPAFGVALTGTWEAVKNLFAARGTEDGLFSRINFYTFADQAKWRSQRPTQTSTERIAFFQSTAERLYRLHSQLEGRTEPLLVQWTDTQWGFHDQAFASLLIELTASGGNSSLEPSIKRAGVIAFRIGCLLTVLRQFDDGKNLQALPDCTVDERDAKTAISLAVTYFRHAVRVADELPKRDRESRLSESQREFLTALPDSFRTAEAVDIAERSGIARRTAEAWLRSFSDMEILQRVQQGHYIKPQRMADVAEPAESAESSSSNRGMMPDKPRNRKSTEVLSSFEDIANFPVNPN